MKAVRRLSRVTRYAIAALALGSIALAGCASNEATASSSANSAGGTASGSGSLTSSEPDVNHDGKVVIGVLSPGDIHDHGYYESFVDAANAYAKQQGWTVIERGNVPDSDALTAARALCEQHVDMIALAAGELSDAIPASQEPACAHTVWYVPSSGDIKQTSKIFLSIDDPDQDMLAAGYAAGLLMKDRHSTKAGFVTGPSDDFAIVAAQAFRAGIRMVIPNATLLVDYDGDFNDSAAGKEAAQAQISQGAGVIYPYLGGAMDAVTQLENQNNVDALSSGTELCGSTSPKFAISVLYSPGDYFLAALKLFKAGKLQMGVSKTWHMGVDPYPTAQICDPTGDQAAELKSFIAKIGDGQINPAAEVKKLGG
jgi:basic membrane protein A